jgi:hypothetical protein
MQVITIEVSASALDSLRKHYKDRTYNVFKKSFVVIRTYGATRYKLKEIV